MPIQPEETELMPPTSFTADSTADVTVVDEANVACTALASAPLEVEITLCTLTSPGSDFWTKAVMSEALTPLPTSAARAARVLARRSASRPDALS